MKALIVNETGSIETLKLVSTQLPPLKKGEVCIAVRACGINFHDTLIIAGKHQYKPELPFIPGSEVAGEVIEIAEGVTHLKRGDRITAFIPWGGYAEKAIASENMTFKIPDSMDFFIAAGFPVVYGTAFHALVQRGRLQSNETLLVLGATGGVGLAAVQVGKLLGAKVIAVGSSDEKLKIALDCGADHVVNYTTEDIIEHTKKITGGNGADVIFDPIGGDLFDKVIRCINWGSRILIVGFASGKIPSFPVNRALIKSCDLLGVFWGEFVKRNPDMNAKNFSKLFEWYDSGHLKPYISGIFPLENAVNALRTLLDRKVIGKIILTTSHDAPSNFIKTQANNL